MRQIEVTACDRVESELKKAVDLHSAGCGVTYWRLCSLSHRLVALVLPSIPPATRERSQHEEEPGGKRQ